MAIGKDVSEEFWRDRPALKHLTPQVSYMLDVALVLPRLILSLCVMGAKCGPRSDLLARCGLSGPGRAWAHARDWGPGPSVRDIEASY